MITRETWTKRPSARNRGSHTAGRKMHVRWTVTHPALNGASWTFDSKAHATRFEYFLDQRGEMERPLGEYHNMLRAKLSEAIQNRDHAAAVRWERLLDSFNPY